MWLKSDAGERNVPARCAGWELNGIKQSPRTFATWRFPPHDLIALRSISFPCFACDRLVRGRSLRTAALSEGGLGLR